MFSDAILSYSLTGKNESELCKKLYMSKDLLRHQHTIQGRENVQMSSLPNTTARQDNLTSHQRVRTSEVALNRKQNASEAQLSHV